jgi:hypothetical protein
MAFDRQRLTMLEVILQRVFQAREVWLILAPLPVVETPVP